MVTLSQGSSSMRLAAALHRGSPETIEWKWLDCGGARARLENGLANHAKYRDSKYRDDSMQMSRVWTDLV